MCCNCAAKLNIELNMSGCRRRFRSLAHKKPTYLKKGSLKTHPHQGRIAARDFVPFLFGRFPKIDIEQGCLLEPLGSSQFLRPQSRRINLACPNARKKPMGLCLRHGWTKSLGLVTYATFNSGFKRDMDFVCILGSPCPQKSYMVVVGKHVAFVLIVV